MLMDAKGVGKFARLPWTDRLARAVRAVEESPVRHKETRLEGDVS